VPQIPSGQRFALEAYGEILFRAWRDTVGPCAAEVEAELQSLMQSAILASTPTLAAALRCVLNGLHSHR
jgi:condensin-2 complex subunit G2